MDLSIRAPAALEGPIFRRRPAAAPTRSRGRGRKRGLDPVEAAAWLALAAVVLAWRPRPKVGEPSGPPLWRRLGDWLKGAPRTEVQRLDAREPGHGRSARHPLEIPKAGWRDVIWRTWKEFNNDRITSVAGGVTFFSLLALFPAIAAFVSLYGLFSDVETAREQLDLLAGFLPRDALMFVGEQMLRIAATSNSDLGLAFAVSLALSLWSANAGVKALIAGLNIAYEEEERRGFIRLNLISLAFTFGAVVFLIVAISLVIALPVALSVIGYGGPDPMLWLRWPLMLAAIMLILAVLYRYGPDRRKARWRWVSWGSVAAAVLWVGASMVFSWYVANFAHYDRTYGSLGAVIGFMTWTWISTIVVLMGAELNAEIEHQTAVDSTVGPPKPIGTRGATMADTLGVTLQEARRRPEIRKGPESGAGEPNPFAAGSAKKPALKSSKTPEAGQAPG